MGHGLETRTHVHASLFTATSVRTVFDFVPVLFPFLTPCERQPAHVTNLRRQIRLADHFPSLILHRPAPRFAYPQLTFAAQPPGKRTLTAFHSGCAPDGSMRRVYAPDGSGTVIVITPSHVSDPLTNEASRREARRLGQPLGYLPDPPQHRHSHCTQSATQLIACIPLSIPQAMLEECHPQSQSHSQSQNNKTSTRPAPGEANKIPIYQEI